MTEPLSLSPFNLAPDDIAWVRATLARLSSTQKIGQLFNFATFGNDQQPIRALNRLQPGGMHRFMGPDLADGWRATRLALEENEVPLLISGDIEGGNTSFPFITPLPNQMGVAACADLDLTSRLAAVVAAECRALGFNWSYTPVVDLNHAFRSAVVGTRSFGSDVTTVREQSLAYIRELQRHGVAATAKHWPGEGYDDRDQHLATTINPLSMAQWEASFGAIYRAVIDAGVMSVMSAHIALPAWIRHKRGHSAPQREDFQPASTSALLTRELLRDELGFNGLVVSDATTMAGIVSWAERKELVPSVIENGCDMFLFSRTPEQDVQFMLDGLRSGALSEQRLEQAVTRVLALKAALGLHRKSLDERLPPLAETERCLRAPTHQALARQMAAQSITLVKDTEQLLPLRPERHRRVVLVRQPFKAFFPGSPEPSVEPLLASLRAEGFELREFDTSQPPSRDNADLMLYLVGNEATPTASHIYLDWYALHGDIRGAMTRYWRDLPCLMISFGQPYFLYDAPGVPAYINTYSCVEPVQEALLHKLLGREAFTGVSPVDAFCGQEAARF
ncbi:glycoside hydrolase family 3 protein [Duganella sp. FT50W]|uniref:beta-N-acetylhexosaminidase n=1 Tax=Duganella lactea TaxID=2692173 RepID=A0A6L8MLD3_9BURK|nr:glycoside hydrolase family 3 protein [Duganella lactea]MYM83454.1 glycoside hydrolase family 3 protein [Duganella lactea]